MPTSVTRSLLRIALLLPLIPVASATTWYVNGVTGGDSKNCKSATTACKTIGNAISLASSGDAIMVGAAIYGENLKVGLGHGATPTDPSAAEGPPMLVVQVVDPVYIPLPESEVIVKPASGKGSSKSEHVDQNGYAQFWVETGKQYVIEAKSPTFNKKSLKVFIGRPKPATPTAHVQIMLKPNEGSFGK